jgi:DNA-directed RNA polymerase subunit RPC12/RpoP
MARNQDNESSLGPKRGEETHKPARSAAGGRHEQEPMPKEASGEALRREMAKPTIASVTTMVCLTCGAEQFFEGAVPQNLRCTRCGSSVFRTFDTPTERDEATVAHLEEEARSVQYGDASPQTAPEDVRDLEMQ